MIDFASNNSVHASTKHTPFFVNGLRHPHTPALLGCDPEIRGEGLARAKADLALAHLASTLSTTRMPMSKRSTSKKIIPAIAKRLFLTQIMRMMLVYSASPTTIPATMKTSLLKKRKTS